MGQRGRDRGAHRAQPDHWKLLFMTRYAAMKSPAIVADAPLEVTVKTGYS
jgi:hypothetical protein